MECFTSLQNIPLFHLFMKILLWDISLFINKFTWRLRLGTVCDMRKSLILKQSDIYLNNWITDFVVLSLLNLFGIMKIWTFVLFMFLFLWSRHEGSEYYLLGFCLILCFCPLLFLCLCSKYAMYFDKRAHLYILPWVLRNLATLPPFTVSESASVFIFNMKLLALNCAWNEE